VAKAAMAVLASGFTRRFLEWGGEAVILWIAVLAALAAVAFYVIEKIRDKPAQREPTAAEMMAKFRELHSRGVLSDAEFRTIKTTLAAQLHEELKDNGQTA
jgi:uncharacterized membrane protein